MTTQIPAELMRERLLAALHQTRCSLTTAQLREHLAAQFEQPVVIEKVYRNLIALERLGLVQRSKNSGRDAHWTHA
jgi:Fe2+ or Zn2+ uptake regulation protein